MRFITPYNYQILNKGMQSFWNSIAVPWTRKRFEPVLRTLEPSTVPFRIAAQQDVPRLTAFLEQFFGREVALKPVLKPDQEIILWIEQADQIVATIRYKPSAFFEGQPIHLIDCFCIHPSVRKTGLATQLLTALHAHTNQRNLRYSLFLKEGDPLPLHIPLYSSSYAYRRTPRSKASTKDLKALSSRKAAALVGHYRRLRPDTVWIYDEANPNQLWRFWKEGLNWMLACVQDSFQELEGGRIGWMTAFFASGDYDINQIVVNLPFDWIWLDAAWLRDTEHWTRDTTFHWYAYQWTTCLAIRDFYGIVV